MELTNNLRKNIYLLSERKHRKKLGMFKCEGTKCVMDTLGSFELFMLACTPTWLSSHPDVSSVAADKLCVISPGELSRLSSLTTPQDVIAVYHVPVHEFDPTIFETSLVVALDNVQDPGNLGTIIRTADWFGVRNIISSPTGAALYNPKVVQATMGAISRVKVHYMDLPSLFESLHGKTPVFGTFLNGESIYSSNLSRNGIVLMGNEGRGISEELKKFVTHKITIPSFPIGDPTSESLNVATATAITLSEFRRRFI